MSTDKKISQLSSGAPAQAGDEYVVARSGANYKLTLTNIAASMPATTITSGNLTFSGTAQRITGDMSNATIADRLLFQTSTTNGTSALGVIPNGTATTASFGAFNTSDPANTSLLNVIATSTEVGLRNAITGTGTYLPMTFYTAGSERVRIDTSGNVGIGGTADAPYKVHIRGTLPTSSNASVALSNWGTSPSGTTNLYRSFESYPSTAAGSYTLSSLQHYWAGQNVIGASSTLTNQYGFFIESNLTGATNNFGIYSNIASGSNRWNFYAAGTAKNYFAGQVGINKDPSAQLSVSADSGVIAYFQNSGGTGIYINAGDNTWTSASDERVKTDLVEIQNALKKVLSVRAVTGRYKTDSKETSRSFLIAQDFLSAFPQAVSTANPEELGLRYTDVVPLLVAAIKELTARVAELEAK
jgi:hypothetical protein